MSSDNDGGSGGCGGGGEREEKKKNNMIPFFLPVWNDSPRTFMSTAGLGIT